jgi:hypothetical protein
VPIRPEDWRSKVEEFNREITRRADAAARVYRRTHPGPQPARESLAEVCRRFVRAALYSDGRLRVRYLYGPHADRAVGYALVWAEYPPRRELCIRLDEARGLFHWELASPELGLSRAGCTRTVDLRPAFLDRLIYALLEQESWQRSRIPGVEPRAKPEPKADETARGTVQEKVREKAAEWRDRFHEIVETVGEHVGDGVQSAVKKGSQGRRHLRRPPSGRPPAGRPTSARRQMA